MSEVREEYVVKPAAPGWLIGTAIAGVLLALGALGWSFGLQNHLQKAQQDLQSANQQNAALAERLDTTNERMRAQAQALGQSVGLTQKQLEEKSNQLIAAQRQASAASAATAKLAKQQAATDQQVSAVQNDVSNVKTDVTGVKSDVASTQADLASAKTQMAQMKGDEGVMSGLIATNHDELEILKHRGDRNYYEFTLAKGAPAQNVGTIKLALKKVDVKKSKFTLAVNSDDRNIEKKDKNLDEPVQFYSGKNPALFEVVVNNISKNQVQGYLSTPKNVPGPISTQ
jgi:multidrug efflux pump subunit AcrA (membrane-fusion protein)